MFMRMEKRKRKKTYLQLTNFTCFSILLKKLSDKSKGEMDTIYIFLIL